LIIGNIKLDRFIANVTI